MSGKMLEAIKAILVEQRVDMDRFHTPFSEDTMLNEDLALDGDGIMNLIMELESRYDISITDEEIEKSKKIGDLIKIVEKSFK